MHAAMEPDPLLDSTLAEADWLRRLARSLARDAHRAEDAVQETLTAALAHGARRSPRAWLAALLRNELRQARRAARRRGFHERRAVRAGAAPSAHDVNARLELQRLLLEALRALEEPYCSTLVARFLDGLPPREIARRAGLPVKTVNTRLERGLAQLRARLDARFGGERSVWLQALTPFVGAPPSAPWSLVGEGLSMGTKAKLVAAVLVAGLGLVWVGARVLAPESRPAPHLAAQRGSSGEPDESAGAGPSDVGPRTLAKAELVAPADPPRSTRSETPVLPPPAATVNALALLNVRVVKRRTGEPLREAEISVTFARPAGAEAPALFEGHDDPFTAGKTDATGGLALVVPAERPLWVAVDPDRWQGASGGEAEPERLQRTSIPLEALDLGEERVLWIEIEHGSDRVLEGQVVAAEDGRVLAGACVRPRDSVEIATDARGFFALPYSSWDPPPAVEVAHEGFTPVSLQPRWLDQVPGVPLVVALERGAVLVTRLDVVGGVGIDAAGRDALELRARAAVDSHGAFAAATRLDPDGRGELAVPARLPLTLELCTQADELLWRAPEAWTLAPGERRELAVQLGSGTLVFGFLRDAGGTPIAGRELWAVPGEADAADEEEFRYLASQGEHAHVAHSARDGRFEFAELGGGTWWIGPAPLDGGTEADGDALLLAPAGQRVELAPGVPSHRVDLVARRGLWITGRVEGEDGRAVARIRVACGSRRNSSELHALSDEAGRFRLGPLHPGPHVLRLLGSDGIMGWISEGQTVAAGASDVVLVFPSQHSIGGRVVDHEGRALDAQVHLLQRNGSLGQGTSHREQGAFVFVALEPGTYSVQAEAPDGRVAVQSVELATGTRVEGLVLTVEAGTRIGVRHDIERNVRCSIWAGDALAADSTVRQGQESFETVPAGPLRIELYSGDEVLAVRELHGRAGRVESVEFDLVAGN